MHMRIGSPLHSTEHAPECFRAQHAGSLLLFDRHVPCVRAYPFTCTKPTSTMLAPRLCWVKQSLGGDIIKEVTKMSISILILWFRPGQASCWVNRIAPVFCAFQSSQRPLDVSPGEHARGSRCVWRCPFS